jgi:hypothetical protein
MYQDESVSAELRLEIEQLKEDGVLQSLVAIRPSTLSPYYICQTSAAAYYFSNLLSAAYVEHLAAEY